MAEQTTPDLAAELRRWADDPAFKGHPIGAPMRAAADALDALRAERDKWKDEADTWYRIENETRKQRKKAESDLASERLLREALEEALREAVEEYRRAVDHMAAAADNGADGWTPETCAISHMCGVVERKYWGLLSKAKESEDEHASDCAVHNEPALPAGPCDCGAKP